MRKAPTHVRLVALDLDGTVVARDLSVSPAIVECIARAKACGVTTTLVTGRMYRAALPFAKKLAIDAPIVCYQGAGIFAPETDQVLQTTPVPVAIAQQILTYARKHDIHIQLYAEGTYFVEKQTQYGALYAYVCGIEAQIVPSLQERFAHEASTKVVLVAEPEQAARIAEEVTELCGSAAYVTRSNPEFVEILAPTVDKGAALRFICRYLRISDESVVAVGDSWNDIPLLKAAAFGIAMGSAPQAVHDVADAVVADVEHDGVVEAYERFVFPAASGSLVSS